MVPEVEEKSHNQHDSTMAALAAELKWDSGINGTTRR
jgi:hypothetical protein